MYYILSAIFFPILAGIFLLVRKEAKSRKNLIILVGILFAVSAMLTAGALFFAGNREWIWFYLTEGLPIMFRIDGIGILFSVLSVVIFLCAGVFSFEYMKHEEKEKRYYGFYLIVLGVLNALCFAGNLITFYLFFEMLTLSSMPLVLHNRSREAVMAGLKYLFYSLCGAYMALFGIYFLNKYSDTLTFTAGGSISAESFAAHSGILLIIGLVMILGFGVKAGMFPMHAWLPAAHPVAPAPASAVLSAVIVKAGVLALLRVVYYIFGVQILAGTWVQTVWMILSLLTVFMGSLLAYREPVLKKRLAYSTVSQLSYILYGLSVMTTDAVTGSLLHVICHGLIKAVLFLCAGAIIYMTGKTRVEELRGIGKEMPVMMWCYTIASLGLIGIPPTGGFISKWYLAEGSLASGIPVFGWLGPVILLVSALLTAGYLLPVTIRGFFPGEDFDYGKLQKKELSLFMTLPVLLLTVVSVLIGLFPNVLTGLLTNMISLLI